MHTKLNHLFTLLLGIAHFSCAAGEGDRTLLEAALEAGEEPSREQEMQLGSLQAALVECQTRTTDYNGGLEILRTCGNGQVCFSDCPWIPERGQYLLGRERCLRGLEAPAPLQCVPGNRRCDGVFAESCNANGQWSERTECGVCSAGTCQMECTPGAKRCSGLQSQTCSRLGRWETTQACPLQCTGAGVCTTPVREPIEPCRRAGSRIQCP